MIAKTGCVILEDCHVMWAVSYWPPGAPERGQHVNGPIPVWVDVMFEGDWVARWRAYPSSTRTLLGLLTEDAACYDDVREIMSWPEVRAQQVEI